MQLLIQPCPVASLHLPGRQAAQFSTLVEPKFSPMVPAGQATQVFLFLAPSALLQKPRGHGSQLSKEEPPDSVLKRPAVQFLHKSSCALVTSLQVPGKQRWHDSNAVAPSAVLHVPAGQGLQEPISPRPLVLLQVPGGHNMQACSAVAPTWLLQVPTGHCWQLSADSAPLRSLQVPAMQLKQLPVLLQVPSVQGKQGAPGAGRPWPALQGPVGSAAAWCCSNRSPSSSSKNSQGSGALSHEAANGRRSQRRHM